MTIEAPVVYMRTLQQLIMPTFIAQRDTNRTQVKDDAKKKSGGANRDLVVLVVQIWKKDERGGMLPPFMHGKKTRWKVEI